jgi:periplasmic protein TonB
MVAERTLAEGMFADSMLQTSWSQRSRRSWTTLTSFGLQAVIGGLLLLLPMLRTVGLPAYRALSTPISLGRLAPEPSSPRPQTGGTMPRVADVNVIHLNLRLRPTLPSFRRQQGNDPEAQAPSGPIGDGMPTIGDTELPSGLLSTPGGTRVVVPRPPATIARAIRTSSMLQGNLIRRVEPAYPPLARSARIEGSVELAALISKEGAIENLRVVSGHPLLVHSAIEAVSQWRYRPYILNGEPVEVETQITVRFFLSGN